jgi:hypothetical protein
MAGRYDPMNLNLQLLPATSIYTLEVVTVTTHTHTHTQRTNNQERSVILKYTIGSFNSLCTNPHYLVLNFYQINGDGDH